MKIIIMTHEFLFKILLVKELCSLIIRKKKNVLNYILGLKCVNLSFWAISNKTKFIRQSTNPSGNFVQMKLCLDMPYNSHPKMNCEILSILNVHQYAKTKNDLPLNTTDNAEESCNLIGSDDFEI